MKKTRSDCPISCSLDILGDKWTLLILRDIMLRGKVSFSDFLEAEEKIADELEVENPDLDLELSITEETDD